MYARLCCVSVFGYGLLLAPDPPRNDVRNDIIIICVNSGRVVSIVYYMVYYYIM